MCPPSSQRKTPPPTHRPRRAFCWICSGRSMPKRPPRREISTGAKVPEIKSRALLGAAFFAQPFRPDKREGKAFSLLRERKSRMFWRKGKIFFLFFGEFFRWISISPSLSAPWGRPRGQCPPGSGRDGRRREPIFWGRWGRLPQKEGVLLPQKARRGLPEARSPGCADTWPPEKGAVRKGAAEADGTWTNVSNTTHIVAFLTRFAQ